MATDYVDHIGDRLDHPERVPAELQHLIADDVQRVKRILEFPVSGRVLDVGCSDGAITRRINERWGVEAVGCDIQPAYRWVEQHTAEGFRYACWDVREPARAREGPARIANSPQGDFDAIYACEVFEHLTDADAQLALKNICAVLKPGGDLIVTVPNRHPHDLYEVGCRSRWAWSDHRSSWDYWKLSGFLAPYFFYLGWATLPADERISDGIWLIVRACDRL